jgi:hypothetical protein
MKLTTEVEDWQSIMGRCDATFKKCGYHKAHLGMRPVMGLNLGNLTFGTWHGSTSLPKPYICPTFAGSMDEISRTPMA